MNSGFVEGGLVLDDREHAAKLLDPLVAMQVLLERVGGEGSLRSLDL